MSVMAYAAAHPEEIEREERQFRLPSEGSEPDPTIFDEDPFTDQTTDHRDFPDFPEAAVYETRFSIVSEATANWYLKKLGNLEAERARVTAQFQEIVDGLERERQRLEGRFHAELFAWAGEAIARRADGKKTLKLLQGSISFRTVPASLKVADTEAALVEARTAYPDLVQTVVKLDTTGYRKAAQEALATRGEILPGVETVPERQSMSIRYGGKG